MSKAHGAIGDAGPVERIFRLSDLPTLTGYATDYHWALIRQKKFPKPIRLGPKAVGWTESSIRRWQQERIAAGYSADYAQAAE